MKGNYFLGVVFLTFSAQAMDPLVLQLRHSQGVAKKLQDELASQPRISTASTSTRNQSLIKKYAGKVLTMSNKLADGLYKRGVIIPNLSCSKGGCSAMAIDFIAALASHTIEVDHALLESYPAGMRVTIDGTQITIYKTEENKEVFDFLFNEF